MDTLEKLHNSITDMIRTVDFSNLWEGFEPLKFALYTDEDCFFDGHYIEKTPDFCANTAIEYQGEMIAIWKVQNGTPLAILTSKIIHEMFHGFQQKQGWKCWANEMEALCRYKYDVDNLSIKIAENKLLLDLQEEFDIEKYKKVLSLRKYRQKLFPYEFDYEIKVEEIEGSANYVEWQVLKQLDEKAANKLICDMQNDLINPKYYFPIRISSYYTGALLINAMILSGEYDYSAKDRPVINQKLKFVKPIAQIDSIIENDRNSIAEVVDAFYDKSRQIVEAAVSSDEQVLKGPVELGSVNIYDARSYDGYLTSTYFLMYIEEGVKKVINGDFVIKMRDEKTIDRVYKWNK